VNVSATGIGSLIPVDMISSVSKRPSAASRATSTSRSSRSVQQNAPVAHLHQALRDMVDRRVAALDELRVDVDLAHVVDDDRHAAPFTVAQHVFEQGWSSRRRGTPRGG
jgi:hypothetical protein